MKSFVKVLTSRGEWTWIDINYRVNVKGEKPEAVAKSWLTGVGLIINYEARVLISLRAFFNSGYYRI